MREISIYIDGSCEENRNVTANTLAGWGFCVVIGDTGLGKGQGEITTERNGVVVTDSSIEGFIGAEVGSNNTAELSAMFHGLRWLLAQGGEESVTTTPLRSVVISPWPFPRPVSPMTTQNPQPASVFAVTLRFSSQEPSI
jgi:hypothetical protein